MSERQSGLKTCTSESQPQSASWFRRRLFQSSPYVNSEWCLIVSIASLLFLKSHILAKTKHIIQTYWGIEES